MITRIIGWLGDRWWFLSGKHDAYEDGYRVGFDGGMDFYADSHEEEAV